MGKIVYVQPGDTVAVVPSGYVGKPEPEYAGISPKVKHFFLAHSNGWIGPEIDKDTGETREPHDTGGVVYRLKNDRVSLEYVASFPKTKDAIDYIKERS